MATIEICMGSSCFSRGNAENLAVIRSYLAEKRLSAAITTSGRLCEGLCSEGPNIAINGELHHRVDAACIRLLLERCLEGGGK